MKRLLFPSFLVILFSFYFGCSYTEKVRDGKAAYEVKQYSVAVKMLQKEYNKAKSRVQKGELAYYLADSYRHLNKSDQSIQWYRIAYDNQYGVDALKEYAYALKKAQQYEEAIIAFKELGIEIGSPYEYRREIRSCEVAMVWQKDRRREYEVELLDFNTGYGDYSPMIYPDNQLVITSDRVGATGDDTYNWTGNLFSDLFLVDLETGNVTNFDPTINTADNEGTIAFNGNYTEAVFTRCQGAKKEDAYCKLMISEKSGERWGPPRILPFVQEGINYGHPSLSKDGNQLYFSCNHPDGWGGYDIYVSQRTPEGWSEPDLMSRSINTIGDEKFPVIDEDTLYFSSDFHPGMGGLDIFRSYKLFNGSWSQAYNLKPPLNSGGDDFDYVIDHKAPKEKGVLQVGYFASTRNEGLGNDDIYRFKKVIPPPEPEPDPDEVAEKIEPKMILDGYVLEKIYEDPSNPNSKILGRRPLDGAEVNIMIGEKSQKVTVGEDGFFSLELDENTDYQFLASKDNYLKNEAAFSTKGIGLDPGTPETRYEIEIILEKIFLNKEIVLENIYYDFDEWVIREDAKPTLNELIRNLKLNPDISIQLGSHTDCRGNDRYNEDLSQKRAQSAVDYLINNGIDPVRLVAKGHGEQQLEVNCICSRCTEEEHQQNRRTTFTIIDVNKSGL